MKHTITRKQVKLYENCVKRGVKRRHSVDKQLFSRIPERHFLKITFFQPCLVNISAMFRTDTAKSIELQDEYSTDSDFVCSNTEIDQHSHFTKKQNFDQKSNQKPDQISNSDKDSGIQDSDSSFGDFNELSWTFQPPVKQNHLNSTVLSNSKISPPNLKFNTYLTGPAKSGKSTLALTYKNGEYTVDKNNIYFKQVHVDMMIKNSPKIVEQLGCAPFETVQLNLLHETNNFDISAKKSRQNPEFDQNSEFQNSVFDQQSDIDQKSVILLCFECEKAASQISLIKSHYLPEIKRKLGDKKFKILTENGRIYLVGLKYDRIISREITENIRKVTRKLFKHSKFSSILRKSESPVFFVSAAADYGVKFLFDTVALECVNSRKMEILKLKQNKKSEGEKMGVWVQRVLGTFFKSLVR